MSLATPDSIRKLQRKLYLKAKDEPAFRFYLLYDKICREDILRHAYDLARADKGAPGVGGVTFATIEAVCVPCPKVPRLGGFDPQAGHLAVGRTRGPASESWFSKFG